MQTSAGSVSSMPTIFTCLSCAVVFRSADEQKAHYRSDHHRYNMKRRVASLPPISLTLFQQKTSERSARATEAPSESFFCATCNKRYATRNAFLSHVNSKKHKETELNRGALPGDPPASLPSEPHSSEVNETQRPDSSVGPAAIDRSEDTTAIDEKIASAPRMSTTECLFCPFGFQSLEENLTHMSSVHSFFIPDAEYLVDTTGLIAYLGEKIAVGNLCIYCGDKGREYRTLEAVRKHMADKSHCKMAYDSDSERLEFSDFYDFTSSYPDAEDEWEDADDDDAVHGDEAVEDVKDESDSEGEITKNQITFGDSHYELVLPSGARIGHRSLRRYYVQSFPATARGDKAEDHNSGAAIVRRLLADRNSALVPRTGGFGAFGLGKEVIQARNRGEAREAVRHVREFRDQKRREEFKTRIGMIQNAQKHYRDPLLQ